MALDLLPDQPAEDAAPIATDMPITPLVTLITVDAVPVRVSERPDGTLIVQPGSRVTYRLLWRGEAAALARYREAVTPGLQAQQKLEDARDGNAQIGNALGRAERYLNLASLAAILLAGVAVALSASRFASSAASALAFASASRLTLSSASRAACSACALAWLSV